MATAYYSTVLEQSAEEVWALIRDFGNYAWAGVTGETIIEDGRPGDAVGAVRSVRTGERHIRQRLLAHSDLERSYTYEFAGAIPFPVRNYRATLRVTPVVDGGRAFVDWWASFDCAPSEIERWTSHFETEGFAVWLRSLRAALTAGIAPAPGSIPSSGPDSELRAHND